MVERRRDDGDAPNDQKAQERIRTIRRMQEHLRIRKAIVRKRVHRGDREEGDEERREDKDAPKGDGNEAF